MQNAVTEALKSITSGPVYADSFGKAQEQLVSALQEELLSPGVRFRHLIERYATCCESSGKANFVNFIAARSNNIETEQLLALLSLWNPREHSPVEVKASLLARLLHLFQSAVMNISSPTFFLSLYRCFGTKPVDGP